MRRTAPRATALLAALPLLALAQPAAAQDLPTSLADALAHAPEMAEAKAGEAAAGARLDAARAEGHPLVAVDGSIGTGRIDNGGFFGFGAAGTTPVELRAGAEMPLYAGGRVAAAMDKARGGLDVARLQTLDARSQTIVATVSAYAGVLSARRIEARFGQLATELAEVEREAGLRFKVGEIPKSELAAATARRAEGDAALAQAQGQRSSAEAQYRRLTGHDAGNLAPLPPLPATPATLDEAIDGAHRANPQIAEADKGIDIARAGLRAARAESLPTIGAFAEATHTRDEFFPGYRADAVTVGVRGHWALWAGGRTSAKIHEADAGLDASEARARGTRDAIDTAVIAAWTGLATANRVVAATAASAVADAEALRSTRLEAKVGAKPTLAVLDAEREATAADAAAITAEGNRLVAAWQLDALTGNLPQ